MPRQYIDLMHHRLGLWLSQLKKYGISMPSQCWLCHAWPCADVVCRGCFTRFAPFAWRCSGCALALPGLSAQQPRCGQCLKQPPVWDSASAWVDYAYPWSTLITHWKFGQQPAWARHFARWMTQDPGLQKAIAHAHLAIPIPLSTSRLRERGYNPAAQLVQLLCPKKMQRWALVRTRHSPAQSQLSRAQRMRNLRGAFDISPAQRPLLEGKNILLVDDVMTTGATLTIASQCLRQAGAAHIHVMCLARTP